MHVEFVDESGTTRLTGTLSRAVGSQLVYAGIWDNVTSYVAGDVVLVLNGGNYYLCICVAANVNIDPFTEAGGPAKLGAHWYVEY